LDWAKIFTGASLYINEDFHWRDLQSELLCESSGVSKTAAEKGYCFESLGFLVTLKSVTKG
jgi:hypothetical protein